MNSREFENEYLPPLWCERDLQMLILRQLTRRCLWSVREEVVIRTPSGTRRSDLETWRSRYEVKKWLTYGNLFRAAGQLDLYGHYGSRKLGLFPKRRVIIGLAPTDPEEYRTAAALAQDLRSMGVVVIFFNENIPNFKLRMPKLSWNRNWVIAIALIIMWLVITAILLF